MFKKIIDAPILIGVSTLALLILGVLGFWVYTSNSTKAQNVLMTNLVHESNPIVPLENASDSEEPSEAELTTLVSVQNPHVQYESYSTTFVAVDNQKYDSLASVSEYNITTNNITLNTSVDSDDIINTELSSGETLMMVRKLYFENDSSITWDSNGEGTSKVTWESVEPMFVTAGTTATIVFTSDNGGMSWKASVKTSKDDV